MRGQEHDEHGLLGDDASNGTARMWTAPHVPVLVGFAHVAMHVGRRWHQAVRRSLNGAARLGVLDPMVVRP